MTNIYTQIFMRVSQAVNCLICRELTSNYINEVATTVNFNKDEQADFYNALIMFISCVFPKKFFRF
jgi:hypothetical protein